MTRCGLACCLRQGGADHVRSVPGTRQDRASAKGVRLCAIQACSHVGEWPILCCSALHQQQNHIRDLSSQRSFLSRFGCVSFLQSNACFLAV